MAIAFDAAASGTVTGTSLTYAHTCSGSNRILFVGVDVFNPNTDDVTGVTYGGVAMTQIGTSVAIDVQRDYLYYLINPPTGANNVVVSKTSSVAIRSASASYTDANRLGQPDASGTNSAATATSVAKALTTVADNCWMVSFVMNDANTSVVDTGTTLRGTAAFHAIGDSNGVITPAGSYSMGWKLASGTGDWTISNASFKPSIDNGSFLLNFC